MDKRKKVTESSQPAGPQLTTFACDCGRKLLVEGKVIGKEYLGEGQPAGLGEAKPTMGTPPDTRNIEAELLDEFLKVLATELHCGPNMHEIREALAKLIRGQTDRIVSEQIVGRKVLDAMRVSGSGGTPPRDALAAWFFNNEADEEEALDIKHKCIPKKYARWPEDAAIQPYCRWAYKRADAFLTWWAALQGERSSTPSAPPAGGAQGTKQQRLSNACESCAKQLGTAATLSGGFDEGAAADLIYAYMRDLFHELSAAPPAPGEKQ